MTQDKLAGLLLWVAPVGVPRTVQAAQGREEQRVQNLQEEDVMMSTLDARQNEVKTDLLAEAWTHLQESLSYGRKHGCSKCLRAWPYLVEGSLVGLERVGHRTLLLRPLHLLATWMPDPSF